MSYASMAWSAPVVRVQLVKCPHQIFPPWGRGKYQNKTGRPKRPAYIKCLVTSTRLNICFIQQQLEVGKRDPGSLQDIQDGVRGLSPSPNSHCPGYSGPASSNASSHHRAVDDHRDSNSQANGSHHGTTYAVLRILTPKHGG